MSTLKQIELDLENMEDIDNQQLENDFMKQLNREKLALKRWKKIIFRVQIIRTVGGLQKLEDFVENARLELEKSQVGKWWEDGSHTLNPDVVWMRVWTILKTCVYMASLFIVMYYGAMNLDNIREYG